MPRGRKRKIEAPTDCQPQFELGDTAENIERRRRERGGERRSKEQEERMEREDTTDRADGRDRGKHRKATSNRHRY